MSANFKKAMDNYVQVKDRIKEFREVYKHEYSLVSELIDSSDNYDYCIFKASIYKVDTNSLISTGWSMEKRSDNPNVNITSLMENCETSAWGRALANFGMQIEKSIASKEEMKRVAHKSEPYSGTTQEKQMLMSILRSNNIKDSDLAKKIHEELIATQTNNDNASIVMFVNKYI